MTSNDTGMMDVDDWDDIDEPGLLNMPPGDEAFLQSHASGEAILHEILIGMTPGFAFSIEAINSCSAEPSRTRETGDL
jgi:hypothetical protein